MSDMSAAHRQVVERATSDPDFRARLMADPRAAVSELLGVDLPADVTITVVEQGPSEAVIVLPPAAHEDSVSDAELAAVAGGWNTSAMCDVTAACNQTNKMC